MAKAKSKDKVPTAEEVIADLNSTRERLVQENCNLRGQVEDFRKTNDQNVAAGAEWKKRSERYEADAAKLREQNLQLEKQVAEMRGYIARINEDERVRLELERPPALVREEYPAQLQQTVPVRHFLDRFAEPPRNGQRVY